MNKSISFLKIFIRKIKTGRKTVTRRIKTNLKVGDVCYFKAGRNGKKEGYIKILDVCKLSLCKNMFANTEMQGEGFRDLRDINDFIILWNKLNKRGYKWEDNPLIYRIEFEYLGESLNETRKTTKI